MNRLDRALGILMLLRGGKPLSAARLSKRLEVSTRTIRRDVDLLCSLGVPIYAEMGRNGGFRLLEGYFLPPVMFTVGEAISLLLGLALLGSLRAQPFAAELATSEQKLLAAVPDQLRAALAKTRDIIGFEHMPADIFHAERAAVPMGTNVGQKALEEGAVLATFLHAIIERHLVALDYQSPYAPAPEQIVATPGGLLWDRDRWYLVGLQAERGSEARMWRADRVLAIERDAPMPASERVFDVGKLLGRAWLGPAMARWIEEAPVVIRLSLAQAALLQQDWYYRHARFDPRADGSVIMTFGEDDRSKVLALLRWLGAGAELIAPAAWRATLRAELAEMLALYD